MQEWKLSYTRACAILKISRNSRYYARKQPSKDAEVKKAIEAVLPSFKKGRKKVTRLVQKTKPGISSSRIRRVYTKEGFSLFKRPVSRKIKAVANLLPVCLKINEEWALDFMSDALTNGRRFRVFNAIDQYSRFCLISHASPGFPANRMIEYLERAIQLYGKPQRIRTDNGPEFISKRFQLWLKSNNIKWEQIQPGHPQQNAFVERFNKTFREDALDANLFNSIEVANRIIAKVRQEYNEIRPHESLKDSSPAEIMAA